MPTAPTPKDRSTARVIRDTLEMESRVTVGKEPSSLISNCWGHQVYEIYENRPISGSLQITTPKNIFAFS